MAELVSDALWSQIEPLLPPEPVPSPKGGRPRISNRQALAGILFVLKTGIPWQALPTEMNCGSGSTCWRRFAEWTELAVWSRLHVLLLSTLGRAGAIHLERAVVDSASVRAVFGGRTPDPIRRTARKPAVNAMC
jgi:transposase